MRVLPEAVRSLFNPMFRTLTLRLLCARIRRPVAVVSRQQSGSPASRTGTAAMEYCAHLDSPTTPARPARRSAARSQADLRFDQTSGRPCPHIGRASTYVATDILPSPRSDPSSSSEVTPAAGAAES